MKLIIITGMPGSGKSEVAEEFRKHGYPVIVMGDIVRHKTRKLGLDPNPKNTKRIMLELREKNGLGAIAKECVEQLSEIDSNLILIEGCRSIAELDVFSEYADDLKIICVHSSPSTRFQRLQNRARADAPPDWESFRERDLREISVGLGGVIALSDLMIVNEGTIDGLRKKALTAYEAMI